MADSRVVLIGVFVLVTCHCVSAGDIYVDSSNNMTNPDGTLANPYPTISAGYQKAKDGDRVIINKGNGYFPTQNLFVNLAVDFVGNIDLEDGQADLPVIDLSQLDDNSFFWWNPTYGEYPTEANVAGSISNLEITNGNFQAKAGLCNGAALRISTGYFTVSNMKFTSNVACNGGAIYVETFNNHTADVVIENSVFTKNSAVMNTNNANGNGGAIYIETKSTSKRYLTSIRNCQFFENKAGKGGAIYSADSSFVVIGSTFTENEAEFSSGTTGYGGAIFMNGDKEVLSEVEIVRCGFTSNKAGIYAGAVGIIGGYLQIVSTSFQANSVTQTGGQYGGALDVSGVMDAYDCVFSGNTFATGSNGKGRVGKKDPLFISLPAECSGRLFVTCHMMSSICLFVLLFFFLCRWGPLH